MSATATQTAAPPCRAARSSEYLGRRATVLGLGSHGGGAAAARFLAQRGAHVTITDLADEDRLADAIRTLDDVPIHRWCFGRHEPGDICDASLLVVNPAVRPRHPLVARARSRGAEVTSEIELFLRRCPACVIGVTGSSGKSTTAAMIAAMGRAAGWRTWLGGNIGVSLLPYLDDAEFVARLPGQPDGRILPGDLVVLELSSFQLHWLADDCPRPQVAVVLNCTPNHLDWHEDFQHYAASKQSLLTGQSPLGITILNFGDREVRHWERHIRGCLLPPLADGRIPPLAVPGPHNRVNARCAAAAAKAVGIEHTAIEQSLREFGGLEHRQQSLGVFAGRLLVDDSKATTAEATMAALWADDRPTWLLAGGQAKTDAFAPLSATILQRCRGAAFFGADRGRLHGSLVAAMNSGQRPVAADFVQGEFNDLAGALGWCWFHSQPGERILLSPACASFDQYRDYLHRAAHFRQLADGLRVG